MTYAETIISNIKAEAARRDITSQDIANTLELSRASVSKRMTGRIEFRPSELEKIAALMDVPLETLTHRAKAA